MYVDELIKCAKEEGFDHVSRLPLDALILNQEVRNMCNADKCKNYGRNWSCPPAIGEFQEIQAAIDAFDTGVLVQSTGQMEDSFDFEVIMETEALHKERFDRLVDTLREKGEEMFPMGAGTCTRCKKCSYPDEPCRQPDKMYPSMEALGLWISDVCKRSGAEYNYGKDTITYTSCVLIKETD